MKTTARKPRPRLTSTQFKYWKLWRLYCIKKGLKHSDRNARLEAHQKALGYQKSSKLFTDREYDLVFFFFYVEINGIDWRDWHAALAELEGEKRRKIYRILSEAPYGYIQAIAHAKFKCADWKNLPLNHLEMLRITVIERARSAARKGADLYTKMISK